MPICEWCGQEFDRDEAESDFLEDTFLLNYDNVRKCLCGKCAVQAIEELIDGVYFETCEKCGKTFDLILEESDFSSSFPWYNGTKLRDHWDSMILCSDCAIEEIESSENES